MNRSRFAFRPAAVLTMALVWMLLWGSFSPVAFVGGTLLGWLITIVFPLPPVHLSGRPHLAGTAVLGWRLVHDLVVSSWEVMKLTWAREVKLRSGIVRTELFSDNDLYQVQVAELISLVPGTVVVEIMRSPRRLYLHVLDLEGEHAIDDIRQLVLETERRVLRAFGTAQEREAFEAACVRLPPDSARTDEWEMEE